MTTTIRHHAKPTLGPLKTHGWSNHGLVIATQDGMYLGYAQGYPADKQIVLEGQAVSEDVAVANAELWVASPDMFLALSKLICPECNHELQHHIDIKDGCEAELGDHEGGEGDHGPFPAYAIGPCGCNDNDLEDDYPDVLRALKALRKAKGKL